LKVAISTENGKVAAHFGRCSQYTLAQIEKGMVKEKKTIENPGHKPGFLPRFLADQGIDCIITGGIGHKAKEIFSAKNIQTIQGISGEIDEVLQAFARGKLKPGQNLCDH